MLPPSENICQKYSNIIVRSKHYRHHWGSCWAGADRRIMSRQDAMIGEITTAAVHQACYMLVTNYCTRLDAVTNYCTRLLLHAWRVRLLHQSTVPDHACCTRLLYQTLANCGMCAVVVQRDLQHHLREALAHDWIEYSYSFIFCFCFPHLILKANNGPEMRSWRGNARVDLIYAGVVL